MSTHIQVSSHGHPRSIGVRDMDPYDLDTTRTVTPQPDGTIVKRGPRARLEEVEALQLAQSLGLPVPVVHEVFNLPGQGVGFSMDHVPGDSLEVVWHEMDVNEKRGIAHQLGQMISLLRSASQGQVRIGACGGGPACDCRRRTQYSDGPFTTEADFNNFLLDFYKATPSAIRRAIRDSLGVDHRITFTHGDLSPRNIITSNGRITGLVDWEVSGWYPEYWEYVKFFECVTDCKDWKDFANVIFETQYPQELVSYQALVRWQKP